MALKLICIALVLLLPVTASAGPRLTEAQVTKLAADFCQKIGAPVTAPATAEFGSRQNLPHWQPRWRVAFGAQEGLQATVEVVDANGNIAYYSNKALLAELTHDYRLAGQAIPEEDAVRRAIAILAASGDAGEVEFWRVSESQGTEPPRASSHTWFVTFVRQFQGVPFRHQMVNIVLDAETGAVTALAKVFPTPLPQRAILRIARDEAINRALQRLADAGLQGVELRRIRAEVVQPNRMWEAGGRESEEFPEARAAWTCEVELGDTQRFYQVWIDTETGAVIGGTWEASLSRRPKPDTAAPSPKLLKTASEITRTLKSADEVRIYRFQSDTKPLTTLSPRSHPDAFRMLKAIGVGGLRHTPASFVPGGRLVILSNGRLYEADYSFQSGCLFGTGPGQARLVSDGLRKRLLKLAAVPNASAQARKAGK